LAGLSSGTGNKRAALDQRKDDLYESPVEAVHALLRVEKLPDVIWEPACGPGVIVRALRSAGHQVYATDLVDYSSPDQDCSGWDFLLERQLPIGVQAIVTNPPFKNAGEFVGRALELCPKVIMLLRLAFLESDRRTPILDTGHLARVHVFRKRLPMMHRHGWEGKNSNSGMAFAWFVWDRNHSGPTELHRVSWDATMGAKCSGSTSVSKTYRDGSIPSASAKPSMENSSAVERLAVNEDVAGSIPASPATLALSSPLPE
jgi:hypothetical protein